jgi:hypothetical protein
VSRDINIRILRASAGIPRDEFREVHERVSEDAIEKKKGIEEIEEH